ncbi:AraC family transcriptional regulator [Chelatococcus sambhunathii]|uniref:AraC family transcriptional regulator n=1 Tax=Chelatococcus sambhunathii TaxID=363953 RepID=A0ABU1DCV3_9HYPH|nr:AraC family transcriptional regulator [Chelatococcus sambhunathii]MDR4305936.1 AraC family transcriptional regulator [Chelatococcus sambhunathii]
MADPLENLIVRPEGGASDAASVDLLSSVLSQIRLTGDHVSARSLAVGERLEMSAGEAHVVVVTKGAARLGEGGEAALPVGAGEIVLLAHGPGDRELCAVDGRAELVVCRFWFDPDSLRGMLFALPGCIHLGRAEAAEWIDGVVRFMLIETDDVQPGSGLMISRLIDLVVIRVLRTWVQLGRASGWLGGLSDARVARCLKMIHAEPMRRWSVASLAEAAGMSRSNFSDRFSTLVGRSPLRYQNEWRLGLARRMLAEPGARAGEVGLRIGYASEAAFSRAYKDFFGHSPRSAQTSGGSV